MATKEANNIPNEGEANAAHSAMRIKSIRIKNFRSYGDAKLDCSSFNILVGRNNHGKSNFIEALEWFCTGKGPLNEIKRSSAGGEIKDEVEVEVTFSNMQKGLEGISNEGNRKKIKTIIGENDEMCVKRSSSNSKREVLNPSTHEWHVNPCGADTTFNNCIPRFEFVQTTKNLREVAAYRSTSPIGQLLSGLIQDVLNKETSKDYQLFLQKFEDLFGAHDPDDEQEPSAVRIALNEIGDNVKKHLISQFPDCRNITFDITPPEPDDLLKGYQTTLDDGVKTTAEEKGDGLQRALMLAIIKAHADYRRENTVCRSFIFFIDEAELHLHPTAQRQLKESLLQLSQSQDQVFITTHSSVFIADEYEGQSLFAVSKEDGITSIESIKSRLDLQDTVFELLGGSPADLLLPPNLLIVEGPSEAALLQGLFKKFYDDKPNIQVIAARGDDGAVANHYAAINRILAIKDGMAIYGERLVILLDKPDTSTKKDRFEKFKSDHPSLEETNRLFELPKNSLEDYYPKDLTDQCKYSDKMKKAKWMAKHLDKDQFENKMGTIFDAVSKCWQLAYVGNGGNNA